MAQQDFEHPVMPGECGRSGSADAVMSTFEETVALYLRLRALGEELHAASGISGAMRGVLRDLHRVGPQTVPQLARRRPVTRQHIQAITNDLQDMGLVELIDNPRHKRSKLIQLTTAGRDALEKIAAREIELLKRVDVPIPVPELSQTRSVLVRLRELMEGDDWRRAVRELSGRDVARRSRNCPSTGGDSRSYP
jgi:DNA-binding MarR family transcriptional regulator